MKVINMMKLGETWPDWWADLVTKNIAVTYNDDGRWRGGPDRARIQQGNGFIWAKFGDYICQMADKRIEVIRNVGVIELDERNR